MSRYDLEEALREFIDGHLENRDEDHSNHSEDHDDHNDYRYAERDHEHDDGGFESKVEYHLGGFTAQQYQGCTTKQAFQDAVMRCIEHWWDSGNEDGNGGVDVVRTLLRAIVSEGKRQNNVGETITVLTKCLTDLRAIEAEPTNVMVDSNGNTYTRT